MIGQAVGPASTGDILYSMRVLLFLALLSVGYSLSRPGSARAESEAPGPRDAAVLTLQQKEWAERAVRRYAAVQGKKWRNWNEAMFERSG